MPTKTKFLYGCSASFTNGNRDKDRNLQITCPPRFHIRDSFHYIASTLFVCQGQIEVFESIGGFDDDRHVKGRFDCLPNHNIILKMHDGRMEPSGTITLNFLFSQPYI